MTSYYALAESHPNIALIKYWGNRDNFLRIPSNNSISFNLSELVTRTEIKFISGLPKDVLILNDTLTTGPALDRMSSFLDVVRDMAGIQLNARVTSTNNFPTSAGIASSASAFSALALAASSALGLTLNENQLSRLARRGSGSACRSIPDGFVEWISGASDEDSYAFSIAPPEHWELADCIAIIQTEGKAVGSSEGQMLAHTSPFQPVRVQDASRRIGVCKDAILKRDFEQLAHIVELDSTMMHAVMMTSNPPLFYWQPGSLEVMRQVPLWRKEGLSACYTIDAGSNIHIICLERDRPAVIEKLKDIPGVKHILCAHPGPGARLLDG